MKRFPRLAAVPVFCFLVSLPAAAQLVIGQYEDEAPLRTWNIFGIPSAPTAALGGAQFARASDASVSLTNPALLLSLPRYSATLTASVTSASMYKYSLVNTGVVSSAGNLTAAPFGIDFGGFCFRRGGWAFAAAAGIVENYGRPGVDVQDGGGAYRLMMSQTGFLRDFHVSVARRLIGGLSLGLGVNYVTGRLRRNVTEQEMSPSSPVTITDDKSESYSGVFLNGGVAWSPTDRLTAALVFRSPYVKKADARSSLRYQAPLGGTDILIEAEARNEYRQPWVCGAGFAFRFSEAFSAAADLAYFGWSRYRVTFFEEPLARPFRNVLRAGGGVEYLASGRLFGRPVRFPLRLGVSYDPQPMTTPRSAYVSIHAGTGVRLFSPGLDVALSGFFGKESGSGNSLSSGKVVLTLTYVLDR